MAKTTYAIDSRQGHRKPHRRARATIRIVILGLLLTLLSTLSATADRLPGAGDVQTLHLGVFPRRPAAVSRQMYAPLAKYLANELGVEVRLHTPPDYLSFWRAIEDERFDIVHYNQYHYIRAHHSFGHRLLVRNVERGSDEIRTAIITRRDAGTTSLQQLRGAKILFGGGRDAMVSYIMAADLLRRAGLDDGDYLAGFAQNPPKAVIAMYYGQADVAAAGEPVVNHRMLTRHIGSNALRILTMSEPQPQLPWAVSSRVDEHILNQLRTLLLQLHTQRNGRRILDSLELDGFSPVADSDYDDLRELTQRTLGEKY